MEKFISNEEIIKVLTKIAKQLESNNLSSHEELVDIINYFSNKPKSTSDDSWEDLSLMFEDIREHAKNNNRSVIREDRPRQLKKAWRCTKTEKTWSIRISSLQKTIGQHRELFVKSFNPEYADIIEQYLNSKE